MTTAVYALSGDPITFGHIDIIDRSAKLFDKLIVAIGVNANKKYTLTNEERIHVAKSSLSYLKNVEVHFFEGLLVDFAYENNAEVIVRGIRNSADVTDEQALDQINSSQMNIDTLLMFAKSKLVHVSSSSVKALQKENGLIQEYVPLPVKKLLERKISNQLIYGITGIMGSGKSYIAEQLVKYSHIANSLNPNNPIVHNIELDNIAREVYFSDKPAYQDIMIKIYERFNTFNRQEIAKIAFESAERDEHVEFLNKIFKKPVMVLLRKKLREKQGIILINSAILIESDMAKICNNHIVVVNATDDVRHKRLIEYRNIAPNIAESRIKYMKSNQEKEDEVNEKIKEDNFGKLISFDNTETIPEDISKLYDKLAEDFNVTF